MPNSLVISAPSHFLISGITVLYLYSYYLKTISYHIPPVI
ncbi:hypothetical protein HMPREF1548_06209 [Clostridium sp. KLE 1755]|nr:hypothetical protein HMPREF1548_06209 [Clostridium sp. KLE 1755]